MNVSSYVYGTSFYHRFDVRPKLFFSLVFIVEAFIVDSAVGLLLLPAFWAAAKGLFYLCKKVIAATAKLIGGKKEA